MKHSDLMRQNKHLGECLDRALTERNEAVKRAELAEARVALRPADLMNIAYVTFIASRFTASDDDSVTMDQAIDYAERAMRALNDAAYRAKKP